jgi:hypothetical protein
MVESDDLKSMPFGERLLPTIIDDVARNDPSKEVFQIPNSTNPRDGWKAISYGPYASAINHVAYQFVEQFGKPLPGTFPTIAYIGPNDVRYLVSCQMTFDRAFSILIILQVIMVAAIKAGYKVITLRITLVDMTWN